MPSKSSQATIASPQLPLQEVVRQNLAAVHPLAQEAHGDVSVLLPRNPFGSSSLMTSHGEIDTAAVLDMAMGFATTSEMSGILSAARPSNEQQ